jgi:eukaryotic-like serine/threonine-protein kinase
LRLWGSDVVGEIVSFRYKAFLSYSHRDKKSAERLHRAIESYKIDRDLVGRETPAGRVPATLRPIFRDRDDFSAGHSLTEQTLAALEASQFLVVVCSPHAAKSQYVNEEIRHFKAMDHPDRVIAIIVDGEPGDPARDCFPPALRFKVGADGTVTDEREEPIAADARPEGDGKENAKQKVVSGLLGLGLDEIVRRAERARRRQNRFWAGLTGLFLLLAVSATASAAYAWHQLGTNEAFLNATLKTATDIVNTAVTQAEKYNVPRSATLELLAKAEVLFDDMARLGRSTPDLKYRKAQMLIEFARNYAVLGQTDKRRQSANEAYRLLAGLASEKPGDTTYLAALAAAYSEISAVFVDQGDIASALASLGNGRSIIENLAEANPDDSRWPTELSNMQDFIGDIQVARGDVEEALHSFRGGLAARKRLADEQPDNAALQQNVAWSHRRVGNVLLTQGRFGEALAAQQESLAILKQLADADPNNLLRQFNLSYAFDGVGNVLKAQGALADALKNFQIAFDMRERQIKLDPSNAPWQQFLSVTAISIGDTLFALGDQTGALKFYRESLAIMTRLVNANPKNATWQQQLGSTHNRIGDLLQAQGDLAGGLQSQRDAAAIITRLVAADPNNARWRRDASMAYGKIGNLLLANGAIGEAIAAYRDSASMIEIAAKADPTNLQWQLDLAFAEWNLALQGDDSISRMTIVVQTYRRLRDGDKLPPGYEPALMNAEQLLAKLQAGQTAPR